MPFVRYISRNSILVALFLHRLNTILLSDLIKLPSKMATQTCTHVTPECPVIQTLFGYRPNIGVNAFFCVAFGLFLIVQVLLGTYKRTYSYMIAVSIGCLGEFIGYVGRLVMHSNPWNEGAFEVQICCLVLAPSFLAAGIYLTLKHAAIQSGREHSKVKPEWYPWIFVGCDGLSILIQAVGGGVAAAAGSPRNRTLANTGDDLIMAGIAFQIFAMLVFGVLAFDFYRSKKKAARAYQPVHKSQRDTSVSSTINAAESHPTHLSSRRNIIFYWAISCAYVVILIRCIYRIHEMAGGWGNPRMRDEPLFLILDGMMIVLASLAMTVAHPGFLFSPMQKSRTRA